jgi:OmpA-OmpF porin, OOP family
MGKMQEDRMKAYRFFVLAMFLLGSLSTAQAADIPGSKDPPFLKRYAGSDIVFSVARSFDDYALIVPDPKNPGKTTTENREGSVTRLLYRVSAGHTALEVLRNYEQSIKASGFAIAYEWAPCREEGAREPSDTVFGLVKGTGFTGNPGNPFWRADLPPQPDGPFCFFTAKGKNAGQDVALTVAVGEKQEKINPRPDNLTFSLAGAPPVVFKAGDVVVMVDVVTSKALENKMVEVKAADMADALATKGFVDLYGIYFDTDKTDIKPESVKTLDEIANLLKIDRSLKIQISGHTDKTGTADHNMKLSEGRAKAVVDALVKNYGIAAARLQAKGYGDTKPVAPNDTEDGRAKNRRVELRKL